MTEQPQLVTTQATAGTNTLDADVFAPGATVGRYRIERFLGRGGMGVVYAAEDMVLGRSIALKLLARRRASSDRLQRRLHREAQALARLSHPNVVTVFDVGVHDDQVYLAMELLSGGTLAERMRSRPLREEIVRMFIEAGRGLAAAHERGIVHRDFKPQNVLLDDADRVRVSDFGLARATDDGESSDGDGGPPAPLYSTMTEDGQVVGTPRYMSPEQRSGERATVLSDQYSFCVAMWEALTGELPDSRTGSVSRSTSALRGRRIPRRLARVLARGLATSPAQRFPSIKALVDRLEPRRTSVRFAVVAAVAAVLIAAAAVIGYELRGRDAPVATPAVVESAWLELGRAVKDFSIGTTPDGRAIVLVRTPDGRASISSQRSVGARAWSDWKDLGGTLRETPELTHHADGRLHVFARGHNGQLYHTYETSPGGRWEPWDTLGADPAFIALGINADGRIELVALNHHGTLIHIWEDKSRPVWSGWWPMREAKSGPGRIERGRDGLLHVFCIDTDGRVQHRAQTEPNNGWGDWTSLGGWFTGTPTVVQHADGKLGVIARAKDGGVWFTRETAIGFTPWAAFNHRAASNIAWAALRDGRIALFATGHDGRLWTTHETSLGGEWAPWTTSGDELVGAPAATTTAAGPLVVIRRSSDGMLAAFLGIPGQR